MPSHNDWKKCCGNKLHTSLPQPSALLYTGAMQSKSPGILKIRVGCPAHNCGGRCLLIAHVQDGRITRLDTDDRPDTLAAPQLRACVRGRAYLRRQYPVSYTHLRAHETR